MSNSGPTLSRRTVLIASTSSLALAAGAGTLLLPRPPQIPLAERITPNLTLRFDVARHGLSAGGQSQHASSQNQ